MHELSDVVASRFGIFTAFEEIDFDAGTSECPGCEEPRRAGADDGNARRNLTASEIGHLDARVEGLISDLSYEEKTASGGFWSKLFG